MRSNIPTRLITLSCLVSFGLLIGVSLNLGTRAQNSTTGGSQQMMKKNSYPTAKKGEQVDDYHGVKVADPYRWLEDLDSDETRNWVEAENKLTFGFLEAIPARAA